jgi:hypothetical protein
MIVESEQTTRPAIIGAVIAIAGNILISFALNIQKYVHNSLRDTEDSYYASPLWWYSSTFHTFRSGLLLMFCGELGNFGGILSFF